MGLTVTSDRTPPPPGECYCNCKSINRTETLPCSKSRDTKTRTDIKTLLRRKVRYCSVVSESVVICQLTLKMAEEIDWRISKFKGLVTLTLTLDRVVWHTVVHHSSTSTYIPNFIGIGKLFVDGRTYGRTDIWPMLLGRLFGVDLIIQFSTVIHEHNQNYLPKIDVSTSIRILHCVSVCY